jgi:hypothetical protein
MDTGAEAPSGETAIFASSKELAPRPEGRGFHPAEARKVFLKHALLSKYFFSSASSFPLYYYA